MFQRAVLATLCWLAVAFPAGAATIVSPLPNIFEGVNMIALEPVEQALREKFPDALVTEADTLHVQIMGHEKGIRVDLDAPSYEMEVSKLDANERSRQFSASLVFKTAEGKQQQIDLNGRFEAMIEVPVLVARLPAKHVIGAEDIRYEAVSKQSLRDHIVRDESYMIGKMLRRSIPVGRPVRARDLIEPLVVERNMAVTMIYKTPFMTIRASAVALEDGGKGDVIRVRNSNSSRVVQATVESESLVSIGQGMEGEML